MHTRTIIRPNAYHDSLVLMQLSTHLQNRPGVRKAVAMMGTEENKASIGDAALVTEEVQRARPNDLFIVVVADEPEAAEDAIEHAFEYFQKGRTAITTQAVMYRTLDAAIRENCAANLVSISVSGKYAAAEAQRALEAGLHVFLFSDNIPLDREVELKRYAASRRLLLMGADCGTALVSGAAIGFANAVRRGPIGVVGASGTGIQEVTSLIHRLGSGITHAIGTGSRDVTGTIGGLTLCAVIDWFSRDPDTAVVVVVSKPYAEPVARRVQEVIERCGKPVVVSMLGGASDDFDRDLVNVVTTLEDAAILAVALATDRPPANIRSMLWDQESVRRLAQRERERLQPNQQFFRGLYSGGTFAAEAALILAENLGDLHGNLSMSHVRLPGNPHVSIAHTCIDMGDDFFTVGRPHPILAPSLRRDRLLQEAADPATGVILLDIVLGHGAHPNPAEEFVTFIQEAKQVASDEGRHLPVIVTVCGVDEDPQSRDGQVERLCQSGAIVAPTNATAARLAVGILTGRVPETQRLRQQAAVRSEGWAGAPPFDLPDQVNVINIGLLAFADSLRSQKVPVTHVDFAPPAGGDEAIADLLADML
ncbi:MAG: acyl-CoA synthetase FdrA [Ardenticatenaceae bacterium]|nr:acyl-CoA synthetase FdrA [Ardenticatenaceae bacterium]